MKLPDYSILSQNVPTDAYSGDSLLDTNAINAANTPLGVDFGAVGLDKTGFSPAAAQAQAAENQYATDYQTNKYDTARNVAAQALGGLGSTVDLLLTAARAPIAFGTGNLNDLQMPTNIGEGIKSALRSDLSKRKEQLRQQHYQALKDINNSERDYGTMTGSNETVEDFKNLTKNIMAYMKSSDLSQYLESMGNLAGSIVGSGGVAGAVGKGVSKLTAMRLGEKALEEAGKRTIANATKWGVRAATTGLDAAEYLPNLGNALQHSMDTGEFYKSDLYTKAYDLFIKSGMSPADAKEAAEKNVMRLMLLGTVGGAALFNKISGMPENALGDFIARSGVNELGHTATKKGLLSLDSLSKLALSSASSGIDEAAESIVPNALTKYGLNTQGDIFKDAAEEAAEAFMGGGVGGVIHRVSSSKEAPRAEEPELPNVSANPAPTGSQTQTQNQAQPQEQPQTQAQPEPEATPTPESEKPVEPEAEKPAEPVQEEQEEPVNNNTGSKPTRTYDVYESEGKNARIRELQQRRKALRATLQDRTKSEKTKQAAADSLASVNKQIINLINPNITEYDTATADQVVNSYYQDTNRNHRVYLQDQSKKLASARESGNKKDFIDTFEETVYNKGLSSISKEDMNHYVQLMEESGDPEAVRKAKFLASMAQKNREVTEHTQTYAKRTNSTRADKEANGAGNSTQNTTAENLTDSDISGLYNRGSLVSHQDEIASNVMDPSKRKAGKSKAQTHAENQANKFINTYGNGAEHKSHNQDDTVTDATLPSEEQNKTKPNTARWNEVAYEALQQLDTAKKEAEFNGDTALAKHYENLQNQVRDTIAKHGGNPDEVAKGNIYYNKNRNTESGSQATAQQTPVGGSNSSSTANPVEANTNTPTNAENASNALNKALGRESQSQAEKVPSEPKNRGSKIGRRYNEQQGQQEQAVAEPVAGQAKPTAAPTASVQNKGKGKSRTVTLTPQVQGLDEAEVTEESAVSQEETKAEAKSQAKPSESPAIQGEAREPNSAPTDKAVAEKLPESSTTAGKAQTQAQPQSIDDINDTLAGMSLSEKQDEQDQRSQAEASGKSKASSTRNQEGTTEAVAERKPTVDPDQPLDQRNALKPTSEPVENVEGAITEDKSTNEAAESEEAHLPPNDTFTDERDTNELDLEEDKKNHSFFSVIKSKLARFLFKPTVHQNLRFTQKTLNTLLKGILADTNSPFNKASDRLFDMLQRAATRSKTVMSLLEQLQKNRKLTQAREGINYLVDQVMVPFTEYFENLVNNGLGSTKEGQEITRALFWRDWKEGDPVPDIAGKQMTQAEINAVLYGPNTIFPDFIQVADIRVSNKRGFNYFTVKFNDDILRRLALAFTQAMISMQTSANSTRDPDAVAGELGVTPEDLRAAFPNGIPYLTPQLLRGTIRNLIMDALEIQEEPGKDISQTTAQIDSMVTTMLSMAEALSLTTKVSAPFETENGWKTLTFYRMRMADQIFKNLNEPIQSTEEYYARVRHISQALNLGGAFFNQIFNVNQERPIHIEEPEPQTDIRYTDGSRVSEVQAKAVRKLDKSQNGVNMHSWKAFTGLGALGIAVVQGIPIPQMTQLSNAEKEAVVGKLNSIALAFKDLAQFVSLLDVKGIKLQEATRWFQHKITNVGRIMEVSVATLQGSKVLREMFYGKSPNGKTAEVRTIDFSDNRNNNKRKYEFYLGVLQRFGVHVENYTQAQIEKKFHEYMAKLPDPDKIDLSFLGAEDNGLSTSYIFNDEVDPAQDVRDVNDLSPELLENGEREFTAVERAAFMEKNQRTIDGANELRRLLTEVLDAEASPEGIHALLDLIYLARLNREQQLARQGKSATDEITGTNKNFTYDGKFTSYLYVEIDGLSNGVANAIMSMLSLNPVITYDPARGTAKVSMTRNPNNRFTSGQSENASRSGFGYINDPEHKNSKAGLAANNIADSYEVAANHATRRINDAVNALDPEHGDAAFRHFTKPVSRDNRVNADYKAKVRYAISTVVQTGLRPLEALAEHLLSTAMLSENAKFDWDGYFAREEKTDVLPARYRMGTSFARTIAATFGVTRKLIKTPVISAIYGALANSVSGNLIKFQTDGIARGLSEIYKTAQTLMEKNSSNTSAVTVEEFINELAESDFLPRVLGMRAGEMKSLNTHERRVKAVKLMLRAMAGTMAIQLGEGTLNHHPHQAFVNLLMRFDQKDRKVVLNAIASSAKSLTLAPAGSGSATYSEIYRDMIRTRLRGDESTGIKGTYDELKAENHGVSLTALDNALTYQKKNDSYRTMYNHSIGQHFHNAAADAMGRGVQETMATIGRLAMTQATLLRLISVKLLQQMLKKKYAQLEAEQKSAKQKNGATRADSQYENTGLSPDRIHFSLQEINDFKHQVMKFMAPILLSNGMKFNIQRMADRIADTFFMPNENPNAHIPVGASGITLNRDGHAITGQLAGTYSLKMLSHPGAKPIPNFNIFHGDAATTTQWASMIQEEYTPVRQVYDGYNSPLHNVDEMSQTLNEQALAVVSMKMLEPMLASVVSTLRMVLSDPEMIQALRDVMNDYEDLNKKSSGANAQEVQVRMLISTIFEDLRKTLNLLHQTRAEANIDKTFGAGNNEHYVLGKGLWLPENQVQEIVDPTNENNKYSVNQENLALVLVQTYDALLDMVGKVASNNVLIELNKNHIPTVAQFNATDRGYANPGATGLGDTHDAVAASVNTYHDAHYQEALDKVMEEYGLPEIFKQLGDLLHSINGVNPTGSRSSNATLGTKQVVDSRSALSQFAEAFQKKLRGITERLNVAKNAAVKANKNSIVVPLSALRSTLKATAHTKGIFDLLEKLTPKSTGSGSYAGQIHVGIVDIAHLPDNTEAIRELVQSSAVPTDGELDVEASVKATQELLQKNKHLFQEHTQESTEDEEDIFAERTVNAVGVTVPIVYVHKNQDGSLVQSTRSMALVDADVFDQDVGLEKSAVTILHEAVHAVTADLINRVFNHSQEKSGLSEEKYNRVKESIDHIRIAAESLFKLYQGGEVSIETVKDIMVKHGLIKKDQRNNTIIDSVIHEYVVPYMEAKKALNTAHTSAEQEALEQRAREAEVRMIHEMLAYGLTDEAVQMALRSTSIRQESITKTFREMVKASLRFFGINNPKTAPINGYQLLQSAGRTIIEEATDLLMNNPSTFDNTSTVPLFEAFANSQTLNRLANGPAVLGTIRRAGVAENALITMQADKIAFNKNYEMANRVWEEAQSVGFTLNQEAAEDFRLISAMAMTPAESRKIGTQQLASIGSHISEHLEPRMFENEHTSVLEANKKYKFITEQLNHYPTSEGKAATAYYVMSLMAVSPDVKEAFEQLPSLPQVQYEGGFVNQATQRLRHLATKMIDIATGFNRGSLVAIMSNRYAALQAVKPASVSEYRPVDPRAKNSLVRNALDTADDYAKFGVAGVLGATAAAASLLDGVPVVKHVAKVIKDIANAYIQPGNQNKIERDYLERTDGIFRFKVVKELMRDLLAGSHDFEMYDRLLNKEKAIVEKVKEEFKHSVPQTLDKLFGRKLSDRERHVLGRAFLDTDITSLLDIYSAEDLNKVFTDPAYKESLVKDLQRKLLSEIKSKDVTRNLLNHVDQLAKYMMTGESSHNLLRNAHIMAKVANADSVNVIAILDSLISLKALDHLDETEMSFISNELKRNQASGEEFGNIVNGMRKHTRAQLQTKVAHYNHTKGYLMKPSENHISFMVVPNDVNKIRDLRYMGWEVAQPISVDEEAKALAAAGFVVMKTSLQTDSAFNTGMVVAPSTEVFGTDLETGRTMYLGLRMDNSPEVQKALANMANQGKSMPFAMPVFNDEGAIVRYDLNVPKSYRAQAKFTSDVASRLGSLMADNYERATARDWNKEVATELANQYQKDLKDDPARAKKLYVNINIARDSAEWFMLSPVERDSVAQITPETYRTLKNAFPDGKIYVRRDSLDRVLGYRNASVRDIFTGRTELNTTFVNYLKAVLTKVFGANAFKYSVLVESMWQRTVSGIKDVIVNRILDVPVQNVLANAIALESFGVSMGDQLQQGTVALKEIDLYEKYLKERSSLLFKLHASSESPAQLNKLKSQLAQVEGAIKTLSIYPLIERGHFNTVTHLGDSRDYSVSNKNFISRMVKLYRSTVPEEAQKMLDEIMYNEGSLVHDLFEKMNSYGDMVAKAVLYNHLKNNSDLSEQEIWARVDNVFVNYNMPAGRTRKYLESVGMAWFMNYTLRITRGLMYAMTDNPFRLLTFGSLGAAFKISSLLVDNLIVSPSKLLYKVGPGVGIGAISKLPVIRYLSL